MVIQVNLNYHANTDFGISLYLQKNPLLVYNYTKDYRNIHTFLSRLCRDTVDSFRKFHNFWYALPIVGVSTTGRNFQYDQS